METPKIYVACLAAYNSGYLHGKWLDALDEDEINKDIYEILAEGLLKEKSGPFTITQDLVTHGSTSMKASKMWSKSPNSSPNTEN
jgi:hypothetical protein